MTQSAIPAALVARDFEALRAAMVGELVPTIPNAIDPVTYDPRELGVLGGNIFPAVVWQSKLWFRDGSDTTTLADEITCIVTLDGSRYKTDDVHMPWSVQSRSLDTPPDPDDVVEADRPEFGQAWLVPDAAFGEWATHEGEIAVWTSRGWVYKPPSVGLLTYIEDELGFIHYSAAEVWENGTGAYGLPDGSIKPNHLFIRSWAVENQTTTAPPATGPAGEQYIIGASATGTWAGHDKNIAWRPTLNGAFQIVVPFVGEVVYDKTQGIPVRWSGTTWGSAAGSMIGRAAPVITDASVALTLGAGSGYAYSPTSAPGNETRKIDPATLTYAAKKAGTKNLQLRYGARIVGSNAAETQFVVGLKINATPSAIAWHAFTLPPSAVDHVSFEFIVDAPDTSSNTYQVVFYADASNTYSITDASRRAFTLEEYA